MIFQKKLFFIQLYSCSALLFSLYRFYELILHGFYQYFNRLRSTKIGYDLWWLLSLEPHQYQISLTTNESTKEIVTFYSTILSVQYHYLTNTDLMSWSYIFFFQYFKRHRSPKIGSDRRWLLPFELHHRQIDLTTKKFLEENFCFSFNYTLFQYYNYIHTDLTSYDKKKIIYGQIENSKQEKQKQLLQSISCCFFFVFF